ncbi:MAG: Y-family DNA polymerase [Flavobacteriaceae bacterium]|nr:Y-family DNA polymerase [Flavobacteriaceae bacterium]
MFALVDCNNFYASCERVFRPDLNEKPVVVLSNNDGCVIARSNEAKLLGIPMGAAAFKFKETLEKHTIAVFSSNYALYGDMSNRVMNLLTSFTPEIEVYSIDEAFLKFENCNYINFYTYGAKIQQTVTKSTGIPISIGFAPTKALAKVANRIAKKFNNKFKGVYIIDTEGKRIKALKWLNVEDVWGIGRRHAKRLNKLGITTAYQFTQQSDQWVRKHMSVVGLRLKHDLEGKPTLDIETIKTKKNIATTRSFDKNYSDFEKIKERVSTFSISCAEKLRKQKSNCNALMVFLHTNGHRKDLPQYRRNIVIKTPFPTNSSMELSDFAIQGLKRIFKDGYQYKKAGVIVMDITPEHEQQIRLFENSNPKHKSLMHAVDKLNKTIGQDKVKLASQDLKRTWKMRQEKLSPRYTTQLDEIIKVKT